MLKILRTVPYYAPAYGFGGPVIHTLNVSRIQASLGYDVRVFTSNILTNETISKKLQKYEVIDQVKIHRFPIHYRLKNTFYFLTPGLLYGMLKYDFDIIHSHSFRTFQTDIATLISIIKRKPFVFTAHGTLRDITLFNWLKNKKKDSRIIRNYDTIVKNFFNDTVDKIIVHSKYEKFLTIKNNISEDKITIIPHGVNIRNFNNIYYKRNFLKKFAINNNKDKMILYVGRLLRDYRNLHHLIIILKNIIKEVKNVKLWLVGYSYDKEYEMELKKLVFHYNLEKNVLFVTNPTRDDIIGAYQLADVVVFPITDSDSFGIPLVEAGAAKCPIITTNIGPAPELVKNGKTGILTEKDNLSQLEEAVLKLLNDKDLAEHMGLNGYHNVIENYTWEIITKKINSLYKKLI